MLHVKCRAGTGRPQVGMDLFVCREHPVDRDAHRGPQTHGQSGGGEPKEPY